MKFDVIVADPPWSFKVWNKDTGHGRSAESHYPTMTRDDIFNLPVGDLAAKNCALFLWAVPPQMDFAIDCLKNWGFVYKTFAFTWVKRTKRGFWHFGMGYYTRANPEVCLLGVKGSMPVASRSVAQLIEDVVRRHSEKTPEAIRRIERLYPGKRYLELFSRDPAPGWTALGNAIDGRDIRDSMKDMANAENDKDLR